MRNIFLALVIFCGCSVHAEEAMTFGVVEVRATLSLLKWVVQKYEDPRIQILSIPPVRILTKEKFEEKFCGGKRCRVAAAAYDGAIFFNELDPSKDEFSLSILLHELVHVVQEIVRKKDTQTCAEIVRDEQHAYAWQQQWLLEQGNHVTVLMQPLVCNIYPH